MNQFPEVFIIEFHNDPDDRQQYDINCVEFCTRLWCKGICTLTVLFFCYCSYLLYDIHFKNI